MDELAAEVEALLVGALFERELELAGDSLRSMLPPEWQELYDSWNRHCDEMERKYAGSFPSMFTPTMRATSRRIW